MTIILGIDPGTTESGWVLYDTAKKLPVAYAKESNERIIQRISWAPFDKVMRPDPSWLVVEKIKSYGKIAGQSTFDTCVWVGRFMQAFAADDDGGNPPHCVTLLERLAVKKHICKSGHAKDGEIRQALIDRYAPRGGDKREAVGVKSDPGPLYGMSKDMWQAFGLVITAAETGVIPVG